MTIGSASPTLHCNIGLGFQKPKFTTALAPERHPMPQQRLPVVVAVVAKRPWLPFVVVAVPAVVVVVAH